MWIGLVVVVGIVLAVWITHKAAAGYRRSKAAAEKQAQLDDHKILAEAQATVADLVRWQRTKMRHSRLASHTVAAIGCRRPGADGCSGAALPAGSALAVGQAVPAVAAVTTAGLSRVAAGDGVTAAAAEAADAGLGSVVVRTVAAGQDS